MFKKDLIRLLHTFGDDDDIKLSSVDGVEMEIEGIFGIPNGTEGWIFPKSYDRSIFPSPGVLDESAISEPA